jgi:hypothetical protein
MEEQGILDNQSVLDMVKEARRLHVLGGFSAQSTASGWSICILQELKNLNESIAELNANITKMRYKLNENTRYLQEIARDLKRENIKIADDEYLIGKPVESSEIKIVNDATDSNEINCEILDK